MSSIKLRAIAYARDHSHDEQSYEKAVSTYTDIATEQRAIDIKNACAALYGLMNDLNCDLMDIDKAQEYVRKAMEK